MCVASFFSRSFINVDVVNCKNKILRYSRKVYMEIKEDVVVGILFMLCSFICVNSA